MRNLGDVLDQMIEALDDEGGDLDAELRSIRDSVSFQPPEAMRTWWGETAMALQHHLGDPAKLTGKRRLVADIFMDRVAEDA